MQVFDLVDFECDKKVEVTILGCYNVFLECIHVFFYIECGKKVRLEVTLLGCYNVFLECNHDFFYIEYGKKVH